MSVPVVSVIVPTYNREKLLPRALDSIVAQTFDDWEIVLVDDGSTDRTADVAARYADRLGDRFICIRQDNRGVSSARNRGIDGSRGEFVTFLDSDDEFLPTKLERQLELFDARPELGLVYSDCAYVDLDGVRHGSAFDELYQLAREVSSEAIATGLHVCKGDLFDVLIRGYFFWICVGMVRREVLGSSIRFAEEQAFGEEWLFYLQVARVCHAGFVDEPLAVYHYNAHGLARADKQRNARRYLGLLQAINDTFDDLTREQRRAVHRNLARLSRQIGYNAHRAGRYREASAHFVESLRYRPAARTFYQVFDSTVRRLTTGLFTPRPGGSDATDWDRLWRHRPTEAKDDALLERERRSQRWTLIIERLEDVFGSLEGLKTIELGSGRGDLSLLLAERGARVTLLDSSAAALEQARCRFNRLGLSADYEDADIMGTLDAWAARFDVALSLGVIEHFKGDDRTRVIRAHHRVLTSGGLAIISVPHAWCIPYRARKFYLEIRGWWPYGMEIPYGRRELIRRARHAGLAQVDACRVGRTLLMFARAEAPEVNRITATAGLCSSEVLVG